MKDHGLVWIDEKDTRGRVVRRHGPTVRERILATIFKNSDGCWIWQGWTTQGYGCLSVGDRTQRAHRVAYQEWIGPIPDGLTLDHYRLNPGPRRAPCSTACVNPAHLEPATMRDNVLRGDTVCGRKARATECQRGHPFDAISKRGRRVCTQCRKRYKTEHAHIENKRRRETRQSRACSPHTGATVETRP